MIPRITNGGHSFKGAYQYFGHDKEHLPTKERIDWTHTENMLTRDPDKAWKVMAYTAMEHDRLKEASGHKATGRKLEKPVFTYSLAWHPEQDPDKEHMLETAKKTLAMLNLTGHEALIIAHRDEPQRHVHVVVNRVHPLTGIAADLSYSKSKFSEFARLYEQEHGKIYCLQREENYQKRKQGEKTRYHDLHIAKAWKESKNGAEFAAALEKHDYHLARGNRGAVVVDPQGKISNPTRHLEGVKAKDIREKLADLDLARLRDADELSEERKAQQQKAYQERQKGGDGKSGAISAKAPKAPEKVASESTEVVPPERVPRLVYVSPQAQNALQDRQLEERAQLFNRSSDRIDRERDKLSEHYKINERKKAIADLEEKTKHPSWWRKLFGLARKNQMELASMKGILDNSEMRMKERLDHLEISRELAIKAQAERHAKEKELLMAWGPKAVEKPLQLREERVLEKRRDFDCER
jgi:hypothetical protein